MWREKHAEALIFPRGSERVWERTARIHAKRTKSVFLFLPPSAFHPSSVLYVCGETSDNRGMSKCENVPLWCGGEAYHLRLMIGDNYFLRLFLLSPRQSSDYHRPTIDVQSFFRCLSIYLVIRSFSRRLLSERM